MPTAGLNEKRLRNLWNSGVMNCTLKTWQRNSLPFTDIFATDSEKTFHIWTVGLRLFVTRRPLLIFVYFNNNNNNNNKKDEEKTLCVFVVLKRSSRSSRLSSHLSSALESLTTLV